ncbi:vWA domain-containing protein [Virgisporangium aurantiacum]|uniref:VWFA domain-containing protein n=1 Tax=Virgisporangium aurantiacum TaxID=175570 RepID=A0A8J3ZLF9_9ACTN|nr:VWA domain-containing protein [Virgisporangium aurantiacum]GIJ63651.1 hypothetical protein Vau01_111670 [Virgisporangium aurantiacum]
MTAPTAAKCLPTYLVVDTSTSMAEHQDLLNGLVDHLVDAIGNSPRVAEFAHMSIITFNTAPHLVLPMSDIERVDRLPDITCRGATNYGAMFRLLKVRIDADIQELRDSAGRAVLRPAVFILTDGEPTDQAWSTDFGDLTDQQWRRRPHVISFGFGAANPTVLGKIATKAAFLAESAATEQEAIMTMITSLLKSLVASASAAEFTIPTKVDGYERVPIEYVD